jgi:GDP-mannose 6-dehydrogenase
MDTRLNISPAYMRPGFAFGGSCLPKDLKALMYLGKGRDIVTPTLASLLPSNRVHLDHAADFILARGRPRVGMIGLSFKPGTDDLRESPLVTLAEKLLGKGVPLRIYDPTVDLSRLLGANKRYIESTIPHVATLMRPSISETVEDADIVVVGSVYPDLAEQLSRGLKPEQLVLDLVNLAGQERLPGTYQGVCW